MPLITDSIGRVLGKRYRLLSALGTGASAHVYLAEDVSLQRHVAVKVLQPGLATDESFLKRFRAEARSVASLNHPHVLRVFDWGDDADGPYLVLEYLGGGSFRDMLDQGTRLSHSQAAKLGTAVAEGLAYAHARGLVHRDIKPANLLFDEEGRVRVADFGVARALAEAAWTEPAGAMVGTARYISPEAAQGKPVDGKADVYSLALVLYEAVTGTVPFVTDTTMGTLAARIGKPLPHHEALGPLDDVLARAAAPDVASRLDAAGLAARLGRAGRRPAHAGTAAARAPAPRGRRAPHRAAGHGAAEGADGAPATVALAARAVGSATAIAPGPARRPVGTKAGPGEIFDAEPFGGGRTAVGRGPEAAAEPPTHLVDRGARWASPSCWSPAGSVRPARRRRLHAVAPHSFGPRPAPGPGPRHARQGAHEPQGRAGQPVTSIVVPAGAVVSQRPSAGVTQKQGSTVSVVVSGGKPDVTVPPLTNLTCAQAVPALAAAHLQAHCTPGQYDDSVPATVVVSWSYGSTPNPTKAPYGSIDHHRAVARPLAGRPSRASRPPYTYAQAVAALQAVGLRATQNPAVQRHGAAGQRDRDQPAQRRPGSLRFEREVNVSTGPPTTQVPSVAGQSVAQATAALQAAGLSVSGVSGNPSPERHGDHAGGRVRPCTPAPRSRSTPERRGAPRSTPPATSVRPPA